MDTFFEPYLSDIKAFLGLPIELSAAEPGPTFSLNIDTSGLFNTKPRLAFIEVLNRRCSEALTAYYQEYSGLLSDPFMHRQLLIPYLAFHCLGLANPEGQTFMEQLITVAQATYESTPTQMGLLLVPDGFGLAEFFERLDLEYRPLDQTVELGALLEDKRGFHLNDAQSAALVVSRAGKPLGWILKRQRAIRDVMTDRFMAMDSLQQRSFTEAMWAKPAFEWIRTDLHDQVEGFAKTWDHRFDEVLGDLARLLPELPEDPADWTTLRQVLDENGRQGLLSPETLHLVVQLLEPVALKSVDVIGLSDAIQHGQDSWLDAFRSYQEVVGLDLTSTDEAVKMTIPQFAYLDCGRVRWVLEDGLELIWDHGRWRFSQHHLLRYIILAHFLQAQSFPNAPDDILPIAEQMIQVSHQLFRAVVDASGQHHGGLLILLPPSETTIPHPPEYYESFITSQNGQPQSATDIDLYRLRLLLSLDGAVVLDSHGNVRSFGHMVDLKKSESLDSHGQGARSLAAQEASRAKGTLSIKISEDGDITVFSQGKQVARV